MRFTSKSFPIRAAWVPGLVLIDVRDHDPLPDDAGHVPVLKAMDRAVDYGEVAMLVRNVNSHAPPNRARQDIVDSITGLGERFVGASLCVPQGGLRTAAFRTFAMATRLITGVPVDVRTTLNDAITALANRTEVALLQRRAIDAFYSWADSAESPPNPQGGPIRNLH